MTKSQFNNDIQNEQVVNRLINKKLLESEIVDEIIETTPQENWAGVDFKLKSKNIFGDDNGHNVDYKSAINNRAVIGEGSINTFAFELQYLGQNINNQEERPIRDGWLFGNQYNLTEYYLLSWIWVSDKNKRSNNIVLKEDDIAEIEVILLRKDIVTNYLSSFGLRRENYHDKIDSFKAKVYRNQEDDGLKKKYNARGELTAAEISLNSFSKIKICEGKGGVKYERVVLPKLYYSKHLSEEPINVLIEKKTLIELSKDRGYHNKFQYKNNQRVT